MINRIQMHIICIHTSAGTNFIKQYRNDLKNKNKLPDVSIFVFVATALNNS